MAYLRYANFTEHSTIAKTLTNKIFRYQQGVPFVPWRAGAAIVAIGGVGSQASAPGRPMSPAPRSGLPRAVRAAHRRAARDDDRRLDLDKNY